MAFPSTYNFNYYRGDTAEFVVQPKNSNGESFDLADYEATFIIATGRGSGTTQRTASATINTETNSITCVIVPEVGRLLSAGTYYYDLQIINSQPSPDVVYTLLTGSITVTDDIAGAV